MGVVRHEVGVVRHEVGVVRHEVAVVGGEEAANSLVVSGICLVDSVMGVSHFAK